MLFVFRLFIVGTTMLPYLAGGPYGVQTGSGNVMLGVNSEGGCLTGNNNTFWDLALQCMGQIM